MLLKNPLVLKWLLVSVFSLAMSGCQTVYFHRGQAPVTETPMVESYKNWHNGLLFGFIELSEPEHLAKICAGSQWRAVRVQESFVTGFLTRLTSQVYTPREVAVQCGGGKMAGGKMGKKGMKKAKKGAAGTSGTPATPPAASPAPEAEAPAEEGG